MAKSILITGGCGFLGTSLVKRLLGDGSCETIRILDNFKEGTPDDLSEVTSFVRSADSDCGVYSGVVLIEGDIRDKEIVRNCVAGVDAIVHFAANTGVPQSVENPEMDMESNVIGTFNMLEAARFHGVKRFVFASSGAPAGITKPPIHEELPAHPVSPYGASKLAGEGYCSAYYHSFGIDSICLRFGNVFGPRSKKKSSVVAKFVRQAINGEVCEIYGDGTATRDFIYVDDLINAVVQSLVKNIGGETFQIATGAEKTVQEVAKLIKKSLLRYKVNMNLKYGSVRLGDVARNYADTSKAQKVLDWNPEVGLESGIDRTVDYFIETLKPGEFLS